MKENRNMWKMHNDNQYVKGTIAASSGVLQNSFNEVKAFMIKTLKLEKIEDIKWS